MYVRDYEAAKDWYARLLGEPTYIASDTEAVWELAERRFVAIEQNVEHAGHGIQTIFVEDFDARVAQIAERGLEPVKRETYRVHRWCSAVHGGGEADPVVAERRSVW
ncbi:VOC family protein [Streptomyces pseudoechinosporeus]